MNVSRLKFAGRYALKHLLICLVIAALAFALVYWGWYKFPYDRMLGVSQIFLLAIVVDVICGPLLTLILGNPKKSKRERMVDLALVGAIQLIALIYALHAMYVARPAVLAFEKDRYVVVSANEVQTKDLSLAPAGLQNLPHAGTLHVGTQAPAGAELISSVELSLAGISPAMRPNWWVPIEKNASDIAAKSRSLSSLMGKKPLEDEQIKQASKNLGISIEKLRYLPITTSTEKDWIVLFEQPGVFLDYLPIDGFQ